jgi:hypothetical protein
MALTRTRTRTLHTHAHTPARWHPRPRPYAGPALQDDWGCEQTPGTVPMIELENEYLTALIAPQFGGKIWRVYDKRLKRELFLNNRANQPVNFAIRKAWTSGGVEVSVCKEISWIHLRLLAALCTVGVTPRSHCTGCTAVARREAVAHPRLPPVQFNWSPG